MKLTKQQFLARLPRAAFIVIVFVAVWDIAFTSHVLYHSQNRHLKPKDYDIRVVSAEDYRALSDPSQITVQLEDGSVLTKAAAWDSSDFKPIEDGARFVEVTTKGTAHLLDYTLPKLIHYLFLGLVGLALTWQQAHRAGKACRTSESNATSG